MAEATFTGYGTAVQGRLARRKALTRAAIVEAARRLFHEQGYEETSIVQIAEAADTGVGTLYGYFPSKEGILGEVLIASRKEALERYRSALSGDTPGPDRVRLALLALSNYVKENRAIMKAAFAGMKAARPGENPVEWLETAFTRLIAEGVERSELRPVPPDATARVLISSYMLATLGLGPWRGREDDPQTLADLERITRMLLSRE
jgi:AcrR family transcriptional regulator